MRFFLILIFLILTSSAKAIDWKSLGKPLDDDTKAMRDRYVYFDASTTSEDVTLDKPVLVTADIQEWLSQHVAEVMTLDGPHYEQQIAVNQRHFTPKGYGEYITSLEAAQIPKLLKEQNYAMTAVVLNPPFVFANGLRDNAPGDPNDPTHRPAMVYIWQAEVPILLNYKSATGTSNYKIYLTAELTRIPMRQDNDKTLIALNGWKFSMKPRKTTR